MRVQSCLFRNWLISKIYIYIPNKSAADPGSSLGSVSRSAVRSRRFGVQSGWSAVDGAITYDTANRDLGGPDGVGVGKRPNGFLDDVFFWGGYTHPKKQSNGYQGWERAGVIKLENRLYIF